MLMASFLCRKRSVWDSQITPLIYLRNSPTSVYLGHHKCPEKRHMANLYVTHFPGGLLQAQALLWKLGAVLLEKD